MRPRQPVLNFLHCRAPPDCQDQRSPNNQADRWLLSEQFSDLVRSDAADARLDRRGDRPARRGRRARRRRARAESRVATPGGRLSRPGGGILAGGREVRRRSRRSRIRPATPGRFELAAPGLRIRRSSRASHEGKLLLDLRTVLPEQDATLAAAWRAAVGPAARR